MRPMPVIALASLNRGKQEEFRDLFAFHQLKLVAAADFVRNASFLSHVESQSSAATYRENAFSKCQAAFMAAKVPTVADDSGIEIAALKGLPGVQAAHFGKPSARESQDQANRRHLLEQLKGKSDRSAVMVCTLAFMVEGVLLYSEGRCQGKIAEKEMGSGGFGYDSLFVPEQGGGKSFAELTPAEKNKISHRALAVADLVRQIQVQEIQLVRP